MGARHGATTGACIGWLGDELAFDLSAGLRLASVLRCYCVSRLAIKMLERSEGFSSGCANRPALSPWGP